MRRTTVLATVMMVLLASSTALAVDPPPLDKVTAAKILGFMGYTDITVKAVLQGIGGMGMGAFSSTSTALVLADATQKETRMGRQQTFVYDTDLGWFCFEVPSGPNDDDKRLRIWTVKGYQETTPAPVKPTSGIGNDTFSFVYPPKTDFKQGETLIVLVAVKRGEGFKGEINLQVKAPPGLKVDPESTIVKAGDVSFTLKITAAKDAPTGGQMILVIAKPDKGDTLITSFIETVSAK